MSEAPMSAKDRFGLFIMTKLRDRAIRTVDVLLAGEGKAPSIQQLQNELAALTKDQKDLIRRCVIDSVDDAVHDFLFALQEQTDDELGIAVLVDGENPAQLSDGLQGELFGEEGWMARFSKFGMPPEQA
jgi:hypothetical protein